jgi:xyloglucan fucosyltransferase
VAWATASAFLYVVLTDCVLVDPSIEMDELFCDPFAGTTWLLPWDFPLTSYTNFSIDTAKSYDNMLDNKVFRADVLTTQLPAFIYLHLNHDYKDKMFLCADDQWAAVKRAVAGHEDQQVHRAEVVPGHDVEAGARPSVPEA